MQIDHIADVYDDSSNNSEDAGMYNDIERNIPVLLEEDDCIELESEITNSLEVYSNLFALTNMRISILFMNCLDMSDSHTRRRRKMNLIKTKTDIILRQPLNFKKLCLRNGTRFLRRKLHLKARINVYKTISV